MKTIRKKIYHPYKVFLVIYGMFVIMAFFMQTPGELAAGLKAIILSRSILITDYIGLGGIGATLLNVVMVGSVSIILLILSGVKPNGSTIMALWMATGFAFFGKNILNMMPITFGVWLYSRYQREPFRNFSLVSLLSATLSPVVSEVVFLGADVWGSKFLAFAAGTLIGILVGFIFSPLASFCVRVHDGYNLYNLGFTGGLISTFCVALFQGIGLEVESVLIWSTGNNVVLGIMLYLLSAGLIMTGIIFGDRANIFRDLKEITEHPGRLATDFYMMFGQNSYINMGIMGILGTSVVLLLGADLNGPTISAVLMLVGYGCFGKHIKNTVPIIIGAIICSYVNLWDVTWPSNILAILFCTGLAPIAGKFGWGWGMVAGFLHVNLVIHIRFLNSGMNLYNNGFATGFVALLLVPIITALKRDKGVRK